MLSAPYWETRLVYFIRTMNQHTLHEFLAVCDTWSSWVRPTLGVFDNSFLAILVETRFGIQIIYEWVLGDPGGLDAPLYRIGFDSIHSVARLRNIDGLCWTFVIWSVRGVVATGVLLFWYQLALLVHYFPSFPVCPISQFTTVISSWYAFPIAVNEVLRNVRKRIVHIVQILAAIPAYAVAYSIFGLGLVNYLVNSISLTSVVFKCVGEVIITFRSIVVGIFVVFVFVSAGAWILPLMNIMLSIPTYHIIASSGPTLMMRYWPSRCDKSFVYLSAAIRLAKHVDSGDLLIRTKCPGANIGSKQTLLSWFAL